MSGRLKVLTAATALEGRDTVHAAVSTRWALCRPSRPALKVHRSPGPDRPGKHSVSPLGFLILGRRSVRSGIDPCDGGAETRCDPVRGRGDDRGRRPEVALR